MNLALVIFWLCHDPAEHFDLLCQFSGYPILIFMINGFLCIVEHYYLIWTYE